MSLVIDYVNVKAILSFRTICNYILFENEDLLIRTVYNLHYYKWQHMTSSAMNLFTKLNLFLVNIGHYELFQLIINSETCLFGFIHINFHLISWDISDQYAWPVSSHLIVPYPIASRQDEFARVWLRVWLQAQCQTFITNHYPPNHPG